MLWGLLFCLVSFGASTVDSVPNPRAQNQWVSDTAGVIDDSAETSLNSQIQKVHEQTSAEIAVVTVKQLETTPKEFATALFNRWGIGDQTANNGLLVLLVVDARRLEMETGYGLEAVLSDGWLGTMQAEVMVPQFKQGNFGAGLVAGVDAVSALMLSDADTVRRGAVGSPAAAGSPAGSDAPGDGPSLLFWLVILGLVGAGAGGGVFVYRRNRTCTACKLRMVKLSEAKEDEFLDEAQEHEEEIGSINWSVYQCPGCAKVRNLARNRFLGGYSKCRRCKRRTSSSDKYVLEQATTVTRGLVEVLTSCSYCGRESVHRYHTARLSDSDSSSSDSFGGGGGGSFGGGSSGGGGAGSSW